MSSATVMCVAPHHKILRVANVVVRKFSKGGRCIVCGQEWTRVHCGLWEHHRDVARMALLARGLLPASVGTARKVGLGSCAVWVVARAWLIPPDAPLECWVDPWQMKWTTVDPSILTNAHRQQGRALLALRKYPLELQKAVGKAVQGVPLLTARASETMKLAAPMLDRHGTPPSKATATSLRGASAASGPGRS